MPVLELGTQIQLCLPQRGCARLGFPWNAVSWGTHPWTWELEPPPATDAFRGFRFSPGLLHSMEIMENLGVERT